MKRPTKTDFVIKSFGSFGEYETSTNFRGYAKALNEYIEYCEREPNPVRYTLVRNDVIVAKQGYNALTSAPYESLYEFGYYTDYGCVVYKRGERSLQDAYSLKLEHIRLATDIELKTKNWGF